MSFSPNTAGRYVPSTSPTCVHSIPYDQTCPLCGRNVPLRASEYFDPRDEMLRLLRMIAADVAEIKRTMPR